MSGVFCGCRELLLHGERVPPHRYHSCDYIRSRNKLIVEAEKIANEQAPIVNAKRDDGSSLANWTRIFSATMDELARPLLLNGERG